MNEDEYLVNSRARRKNAGSRLKSLIEQEEQTEIAQSYGSNPLNDEDENVNLLFQEDENDQEFYESSSEIEDEDEGEEEDEGQHSDNDEVKLDGDEERGSGITGQLGSSDAEQDSRSKSEENVDSDEILSDSDLSMSNDDETEGEKELEEEEKRKRRKMRKKAVVPQIRVRKEKMSSPKNKSKLSTSESILLSKRSSSRATTIESRQELVKKLKASEYRRANMTPIIRYKEPEPTQEERLEQAKITAQENVTSLHQFREQEFERKEKQRENFKSKRVKLKEVLRFTSNIKFVSPTEEVEEARFQYFLDKSKKRAGRRKRVMEITEEKIPGSVDLDLPYVVKHENESNSSVAIKKEERIQLNSACSNNVMISHEANAAGMLSKQNSSDSTYQSVHSSNRDNEISQDKISVLPNNRLDIPLGGSQPPLEETASQYGSKLDNNESSRDLEIITNGSNDNNSMDSTAVTGSHLSQSYLESSVGAHSTENINLSEENSTTLEPIITEKASNTETTKEQTVLPTNTVDKEYSIQNDVLISENAPEKISNDGLNRLEEQRSVEPETFEEKIEIKVDEKVEAKDVADVEVKDDADVGAKDDADVGAKDEAKEEFEGPFQKVAQNLVTLLDFDESVDDYKLNSRSIKSILFGSQALLPASRRIKDPITIIKIGSNSNPYSVSKPKEDKIFQSALDLSEDNPIFDELRRLPKLGVAQAIFEEEDQEDQEASTSIVIKTEAPIGLYLPNGNKKACLIHGTEVKYFDPATGIPYGDVETYKFLKTIEQGSICWYYLPEEQNDNGVVELYLNRRDGQNRAARGVPDNFYGS